MEQDRHRCHGKGPTDPAGWSEPLGLAQSQGGHQDEYSPDEVCEASVQLHGGGGAAEHGQDALQVQELQLLAVTAGEQNPHTNTSKVKGRLKR